MATGSYDANGIWQYGEDDNIALFSDLLNLATESTSDAFTDDRARLATLENGSLAGIIPLKPTTVTVAGGTAAVNTLGVVTFTTATSLSLNGIFSSSFDGYKIIINALAAPSPAQLNFRLRVSGTDSTGASYTRTGVNQIATSGLVSWWDSGATAAGINNLQDTHKNVSSIELFDPNKAARTTAIFQSRGFSGGSAYYAGAILHTETVAYDGFTIYPASGSFTGTIQIFGYND